MAGPRLATSPQPTEFAAPQASALYHVPAPTLAAWDNDRQGGPLFFDADQDRRDLALARDLTGIGEMLREVDADLPRSVLDTGESPWQALNPGGDAGNAAFFSGLPAVETAGFSAFAPIAEFERGLAGGFAVPQAAETQPRDPEETLRFGRMAAPRWLVEDVVRAAGETGMEPALMLAIADKESSLRPAVGASTSSARGLMQFITRTWLGVMHAFGPDHGLHEEAAAIRMTSKGPVVDDPKMRAAILALRDDPYLSAVMAGEMLRRDAQRIERVIGRPLTSTEIYLAHFLGPRDAERFIAGTESNPGLLAATLLPRPARANRAIFYARNGRRSRALSVAEVKLRFDGMIDMRLDRYSDLPAAGIAVVASR